MTRVSITILVDVTRCEPTHDMRPCSECPGLRNVASLNFVCLEIRVLPAGLYLETHNDAVCCSLQNITYLEHAYFKFQYCLFASIRRQVIYHMSHMRNIPPEIYVVCTSIQGGTRCLPAFPGRSRGLLFPSPNPPEFSHGRIDIRSKNDSVRHDTVAPTQQTVLLCLEA